MDYTKLIDKKRELDQYRPLPTALVKNLEDRLAYIQSLGTTQLGGSPNEGNSTDVER